MEAQWKARASVPHARFKEAGRILGLVGQAFEINFNGTLARQPAVIRVAEQFHLMALAQKESSPLTTWCKPMSLYLNAINYGR